MDKIPERLLIDLICLFFMIDIILLLKVFDGVNLEILPFYEYFNLQVSSFFIKSNCCYALINILHSFLKQLDSCLSPQVV